MAAIVLVHGIAQEQFAAAILEDVWLPALAGGVANSGDQSLADRIWRAGARGDIDTRMAFYGSSFIDAGAQGGGEVDLDTEPLSEDAEELTKLLAMTWLEAAAESASDPGDRIEARHSLDIIGGTVGEAAQGRGTLGRPVLNALTSLRWFAPFGMAVASKFVWKALTQVTRYLTDDRIRTYAQDQVLAWIEPDTRLIIGHSLGSVVAYEALHRAYEKQLPNDCQVTLMTLGSPLGLQNVIYNRLQPPSPLVPAAVNRWENLVALDDLVAAKLDLATYFHPQPRSSVQPVSRIVENGSRPHQIEHYLTKRIAGQIVSETLAESLG